MVMTTMAMFGRYSGLSKPLRASCMATEARGQQNNRRLCNTNKKMLVCSKTQNCNQQYFSFVHMVPNGLMKAQRWFADILTTGLNNFNKSPETVVTYVLNGLVLHYCKLRTSLMLFWFGCKGQYIDQHSNTSNHYRLDSTLGNILIQSHSVHLLRVAFSRRTIINFEM